MNLMVDPGLLDRASAALGTSNKSDAVNTALARLADDAAVLGGLAALVGMFPDYPDVGEG
jgi:uncharacterized protein YbjQ (UPF0145 family)